MKIRRFISLLTILVLVLALLPGCGRTAGAAPDPSESPSVGIRVDENGLATWDPVEGAQGYMLDLLYMEGDSIIGAGGTIPMITEPRFTIPYGCKLIVMPVLQNGEQGDTMESDWYGDKNSPDIEAFQLIISGSMPRDEYMPGEDPGAMQTYPRVEAITIDETNIAHWEAVEGAQGYQLDIFYMQDGMRIGSGGILPQITQTWFPVPYGCLITVVPVMENGMWGNVTESDWNGDQNEPDIGMFFALLKGVETHQDLSAYDIDYVSGRMVFPRDLVEDSVTYEGGVLRFQLQGTDGHTVTFEASDAVLEGDALILQPGSTLRTVNAIGRIKTAYIKTDPHVNIQAYGGYSFSNDTEASADSLYELACSTGSLFYMPAEPNYFRANAIDPEPTRITSMQFGYDPGLTGLATVEFNRSFFPEYLPGDLYDESIETRWDPDNELLDFYLILTPDSPTADTSSNAHSIWGTANYKTGNIKDGNGNVVSKDEPLPEGATLEVTFGDITMAVELVMPQHTTAVNLYETTPTNFAQATGSLNALVIPVVFSDQTHRANEEHLQLMRMALGRVMDENGNVTEYSPVLESEPSFSAYYDTASFGALQVTSFLTDWYYYPLSTEEMMDNGYSREEVSAMVEWVKSQYPDMDWSSFDNDGNGFFDTVVFINVMDHGNGSYSMTGAAGGTHNTFGYTNDGAGTPDDPAVSNFINVGFARLYPEMTITDGSLLETSVLIHEFGHNLGLVDYYDVTYSGINAVGSYDMQSGSIGDWNSYSKYAVGWIDPIVITQESFGDGNSVELTIGSAALTGDAIVIPAAGATPTGTPLDEYILIDLFTPDGNHTYDSAAYGLDKTQGVRIYHVDARYILRTLTNEKGEDCVIGTIARSNSYSFMAESQGQYHIELIQAGGKNTFTNIDAPRPDLRAEDLFKAGSVFTAESYSEFFYNGLMDAGIPFGYEIRIVSISNGTATIRITKK